MIRRLPLLVLLTALPAQAEDFTGFYAGVNAGYGWTRDRSEGGATAVPPSGSTGEPRAATALPPSASAAAAPLQRAGRNTNGR